ncbi:DNA repair protein rad8 [Madurella mycetomatis]|uniref:DNA repair protein rad8 n=1 Tax=Madurella mycetomatis TaxID=100816 RepID=A0A175VY63_9PEZI|nr:DNA repair protein rad8 [Madurella mycetomatis]
MESAAFTNYIAAGCLVLDKVENKFPQEIWSLLELAQWRHFGPFTDDDAIQNGTSETRFLAPEVQRCLLSSSGCLSPYAGLLSHRWIHMSLSISLDDPAKVVARVYILPDDTENSRIPRWDPSLRKARLALLARLDFSKKAWKGEASAARSPSPAAFGSPELASGPDGCEGQSLLQMFNSIPSPDPKLEDIQDFDARDAAYRLIDSDIAGLRTTLYSYQRRSAVLMLQREVQGQKILDPRLVKVVDQLGAPWYYDAVAGIGFREPRYYDRPCGGILAEEMGAGKTLICLALILATRHIPSSIPDIHRTDSPVVRPRLGSLADMAAACITRNSVPWRTVFGGLEPNGIEYSNCVDAIRRNPGFYEVPPLHRRKSRQPNIVSTPTKVYLSHASLVIVPPNLVQQWKQEIAKHTSGLKFLVVDKKQKLPPAVELADFDVVLFSSTRFERMWKGLDNSWEGVNTLAQIHFKRCIVDEGHKLGNSTMRKRSDVHLFIDHLRIASKWIVTGTPSKGLFGVDDTPSLQSAGDEGQASGWQAESSRDLEKDDLKRIGSIATYYLQMRPWANLPTEIEDSQADWTTYVMQPGHSPRSAGRADCLRRTLESLIIRHRLPELGSLLPTVDEKIVYLDGSYQDTLVLNLFSMMIIANAVQSERKDQDYLFHPRQRKALIELVSNLRRASFFGGSFFSPAEIRKTVEMAEEFLREGKVQTSDEDVALLREAIAAGRLAETNIVKTCANLFHEIPLYVQNFPWGAGQSWSLDLKEGDPVCTDSRMVLELQKVLQPLVDAPASLQIMFESGRFAERGLEARLKGIDDQDPVSRPAPQRPGSGTLAGNAQPGQDNGSPGKRRSVILGKGPAKVEDTPTAADFNEIEIAAPLAGTQLISTASAKLSYLIDQISKYQKQEQIIVFYENDNVAYYLAGVLEILQVQHLIYAKGLTPERRAQYVATFNFNPKFRVLLMDITQAAFGLDMKSASRIYFINPVLNPQVEAQAIGRARRISQKKPVSVETLVLRGSVEEVIVKRRTEMTQAEQWKCRSILDDKPIYEWILNAKILPLPGGEDLPGVEQMVKLQSPQFIFGRGFGRELSHPDQDLVTVDGPSGAEGNEACGVPTGPETGTGRKRRSPELSRPATPSTDSGPPPKRRPRVQFAD